MDDLSVIQYKIELLATGMEDGPPGGLSPAQRLEKLRKYQDAWRTLRMSRKDEVKMLSGQVWELYGGVFAQGRGSRAIKFWQLPSVIRGVKEEEWEHDDLGINIRDFGMDPSQDLLVMIERPMSSCVLSITYDPIATQH